MPAPSPPKILTRERALGCIVINVLAFPGLGTIWARRKAGYVQATVMVAGFCLFIAFIVGFFFALNHLLANPADEQHVAAYYREWGWALWSGLGLCASAWCAALASSIGIWRQIRGWHARPLEPR